MTGRHVAGRRRGRLFALLAGIGLGIGLAAGAAALPAQAHDDSARLCAYVATHPGWQVNGLTDLGSIAQIAPGLCSAPIGMPIRP